MYTEQDVENLAEFLYLAHSQTILYHEDTKEFERMFIEWKELKPRMREAWITSARVAFQFTEHKIK